MGRIVFTNPEHSNVQVHFDDGQSVCGSIARGLGEYQIRYDALIAAGVVPEPYAPPAPPTPEMISDRQFAQGLAAQGILTEGEAEEWVGPGTVPAALLAFVNMLPASEQFAARMLLRGATIFDRNHPLTQTFAAANGWTSEQTDNFWRYCSML